MKITIAAVLMLGCLVIAGGCGTKPASLPPQNTTSPALTPPWQNIEVFADAAMPINVTVGQEFIIKFNQFTSSNVDFQPANVVVVESKQFVQNPGVIIPDGTTWILFKAVAAGSTKVSVTETTRFGDPLQTKTFMVSVEPPSANISGSTVFIPWSDRAIFADQTIPINVGVGQEFVIRYYYFNNMFASFQANFTSANTVSILGENYGAPAGQPDPATGSHWYLLKAVKEGSTNLTIREFGHLNTGEQSQRTFTINVGPIAPQTVTALPQSQTNTKVYSPATSTIYVIVSPPGSGSVSPSTGNYTYGTNVTFIATPANGYVFSSWWYYISDSSGGRGGVLGKNATLNLAVERSENVTAYFVALPTNWNNAAPLGQVHRPIAVGEYFYISQDYIAGQFGPDSVNATFDKSLIALTDRKDAGSVGPLTPGMHAAAVWLLFRALKPGTAQISVTQIRNGYSDPPKTYSVTIGN